MQAREEITISAAGADGNHATVVYPPRAATGTLETISFFQARYISFRSFFQAVEHYSSLSARPIQAKERKALTPIL